MGERIRVLEVPAFGINGGIYKYIFNNMKYIDHNRFEFDFLTRNRDILTTAEYKKYGFGVRFFTAKERENPLLLEEEMNHILDKGYDVIHFHNAYWTGNLLEKIAMQRGICKVIIHSHSTQIDNRSDTETKKLLAIHEKCKAECSIRSATDFCACSQVAAKWLFGEQIPMDRIQLMKNAIEVEKYTFSDKIRQRIREKIGLQNKFVLGQVGRFAYQKNYEFSIEVFKDIHSQYPNAILLLVGNGVLENEIRARIEKYQLADSVCMLSWSNHVEELLQAMDMLLLPSRFEGLPITLIEAQAADLKCLVSSAVTDEVRITEKITFLDLCVNDWIREIGKAINETHIRENREEEITKAGYNIHYQVKKLEKLYGGRINGKK